MIPRTIVQERYLSGSSINTTASGTASNPTMTAPTTAARVVYSQLISREQLISSGLLLRKEFATPPKSLFIPNTIATSDVDAAKFVGNAWEQAHKAMPDPKSRVPRELFVDYCIRSSPLRYSNADLYSSYLAYLHALFDMATALMLPASKNDLGKHCFGYAALLAKEFYWDKPSDFLSLTTSASVKDRYTQLRFELDQDWSSVSKDSDGRVSFEAFRDYFVAKHSKCLIADVIPFYEAFLRSTFRACLSMMLPNRKETLGGHCFRYGAIIAGEFYFDAAKQATAGCGCDSPVLDVLGCV